MAYPVRNEHRCRKVVLLSCTFSQRIIMYSINFKTSLVQKSCIFSLLLLPLLTSGAGAIPMGFDVSIYYEPSTKEVLPIGSAIQPKVPQDPVKYFSSGLGCSCEKLACGCCVNVNATDIKFDHKLCANFSAVPERLALEFHIVTDQTKTMIYRLSAIDPVPICIPLAPLPVINFCLRFYELGLQDNRFHGCMNFETKLGVWTIFVLRFNCVTLGTDGLAWVKPKPAPDDEFLIANATITDVYGNTTLAVGKHERYHVIPEEGTTDRS